MIKIFKKLILRSFDTADLNLTFRLCYTKSKKFKRNFERPVSNGFTALAMNF